MTKKSTRRLIRKRQLKRNVKDSVKNNVKSHHSVREQMLNGIAQNMANGIRPFGMFGTAPQQYGNINNERRIEQLRNDTHSKQNELQNIHAITDVLQKQVEELSNEVKNAKKREKEVKTTHDKLLHDKEMSEDKLRELTRINLENERLQEKKRIMEIQQSELKNDIDLNFIKNGNENLKNTIHQNEMLLLEHKQQLTANALYNEQQRLESELQPILAKIDANNNILKSEEFKNPNKKYIEKHKKLMLEKEKLRQQEELMKLSNEIRQQQ